MSGNGLLDLEMIKIMDEAFPPCMMALGIWSHSR
jgi:hypothetical protein